jgi:hypothetical protein
LGERLLCKQEVVGSIPSASTITRMPRACGIEHAAPVASSSFSDIVHRKYEVLEV